MFYVLKNICEREKKKEREREREKKKEGKLEERKYERKKEKKVLYTIRNINKCYNRLPVGSDVIYV